MSQLSRMLAVIAALLLGVMPGGSYLVAAARAPELSATQIVDRAVKALGGRAALARLNSYSFEAEIEGLSGFSGRYRLTAQRPDRRRISWDIRYLAQTVGYDGRAGWEQNVAVREVAGPQLERLRRASLFLPIEAILGRRDLSVTRGETAGAPVYILSARNRRGADERLEIDARTFLPLRDVRQEPYEEGLQEIMVTYGDYRRVEGLMLPFQINEQRPDLSFLIRVSGYDLDPKLAAGFFENPNRGNFGQPFGLSLATLPGRVYKEDDNIWDGPVQRFWGMPFPAGETWTFDMLVDESQGRFLAPAAARADFYARGKLVQSTSFTGDSLRSLQRFPATRFDAKRHIYSFRHNFGTPQALGVDRMVYTLTAEASSGERIEKSLDIPLSTYRAKHKFIFPLRGNFIVLNGHESYELHHKYEASQQYAVDVAGLGPNLQLLNPDGSFYAYGRTEILAPADGTVVYARNDVPDGKVKQDYLKMADGIWAIGGNIVLVDHGGGEYSLFAHMREGSVRVKRGDRLRQGDVIGLMGMSGSPGHPHLHYQLQSTPELFAGDGLPVQFENVEPAGWFEGAELNMIRRGVFLRAR